MAGLEDTGTLGGPHVINFQYDDQLGCDLDVLCHGVRFHIMVELSRLQGKSKKVSSLVEDYRRLMGAVRTAEEEDSALEQAGQQEEVQENQQNDSRVRHAINESSQSHQAVPGQDKNSEDVASAGTGSDSGYDTRHATGSEKSARTSPGGHDDNSVEDGGEELAKPTPEDVQVSTEEDDVNEDPQGEVQKWVLTPFKSTFAELAPVSNAPPRPTLHDYYHTKVFFFTLEVDSEELVTVELEEDAELRESIAHLVPCLQIPKYIRNIKVPTFSSHEVRVLSESDTPAPIHPARVQVGGDTRFLKLVDATQPSTTKRELSMLAKIERLGLHEQMRIPHLLGLVGQGDSKTSIMGFLLTDIGDATPLTEMLDEKVPAQLREKWSREAEKMVELLHEHGLVWGDAKADNFLVDANEDLWMIDFGGSYTEGYIDPELCETTEGDEQGLNKVLDALEDPAANTFDPEAEQGPTAGQARRKGRTEPNRNSSALESNSRGKRKREEPSQAGDSSIIKKSRS